MALPVLGRAIADDHLDGERERPDDLLDPALADVGAAAPVGAPLRGPHAVADLEGPLLDPPTLAFESVFLVGVGPATTLALVGYLNDCLDDLLHLEPAFLKELGTFGA